MTVAIVHPRFLASVPDGFFRSSATIEEQAGTTLDAHGQPIAGWLPVAGLQALKAARAPLSAMERQAAGYTATDRVWHVLLKGAHPEITTAHRAVVDFEEFDIDAAETDQTQTVTRLRVRQVTT